MSRRTADVLYAELRPRMRDLPSTESIWKYRDSLEIPELLRCKISAGTELLGCKDLGHGRYIDTTALLTQVMACRALVTTMDLTLGKGVGAEKSVLVVFSVDGAQLNSNSGGVFGFLRILNQVNFIDSPLMQFPVLMALTEESRAFYGVTLPPVIDGLVALRENGIDVLCVDSACLDNANSLHHFHRS